MPGNTFGHMFRVTTFGESHGKAIGVVIDGVPAGLSISEQDIQRELSLRRPGRYLVSTRRESDDVEILSGVFNGRTTGSPIALLVRNVDVVSKPYEELRYTPRPGHADLPYILKYGFENWDYRGGGRASARETVARVAAGAVAKKLLGVIGVMTSAHLVSVGTLSLGRDVSFEESLCFRVNNFRTCCRDFDRNVESYLENVFREGDSVGGIVEFISSEVPPGLGEPVFDKLKADLAKAFMSVPATMGVEFGVGYRASSMKGSEYMDSIVVRNGRLRYEKNVAGGIVGGLSVGEEIRSRVYFKPTSSIRKPIRTVDLRSMDEKIISVKGRHDPCVAVRAVPIIDSMGSIVLADHALRAGLINPVKLSSEDRDRAEDVWRRYEEIVRRRCGG